MAGYERGSGTTSMPSEADARLDRPVRLEWSALFAGTLMGWGVLLVLSLIGMVLGLSVIDPFTARPVTSNSGAALWGAVSAIVSSFIGGFAVVRLAGDRRRGVSLVHGTVSWALSILLAGLIALFVSGVAAFTRTPARNPSIARNTRGQTAALVATTGDGSVVAIFAAGGAVLALVGSLLGSLAAASRSSGVPFSDEFRLRRPEANGHPDTEPPVPAGSDERRDETTILPPTH